MLQHQLASWQKLHLYDYVINLAIWRISYRPLLNEDDGVVGRLFYVWWQTQPLDQKVFFQQWDKCA